ncbi:MAG: hypothetical protein IKA76_03415, partial [Clostridia bacterium]|nr:hypothetical protein [Clostridia bacterium]
VEDVAPYRIDINGYIVFYSNKRHIRLFNVVFYVTHSPSDTSAQDDTPFHVCVVCPVIKKEENRRDAAGSDGFQPQRKNNIVLQKQ